MATLRASPATPWVRRYPIPIELPVQTAALTAARGRDRLTLIRAAPASPAAMGEARMSPRGEILVMATWCLHGRWPSSLFADFALKLEHDGPLCCRVLPYAVQRVAGTNERQSRPL